jgi:decaprenylphospho-beta-D-erythro-pentofuranosid-2-ulose 2-reductase
VKNPVERIVKYCVLRESESTGTWQSYLVGNVLTPASLPVTRNTQRPHRCALCHRIGYNGVMSQWFQRTIIVGASSGMGEELARQLAARGSRVALVARRADELARLAAEINEAPTASSSSTDSTDFPRALTYPHDVRSYDDVPALFQTICRDLGGLDLIIYAAGVMPRILPDEYDFEKDRAMMEVNVLGAAAWLNAAARRFQAAGGGTIVGISSVAGDRGRRGQPVYCASKAALDTYLESLRNRLGQYGVRVVTIKPGPVATPMTRDLGKLPLLINAPDAARQILTAAARGRRVAYIPWKWRPIMAIIRAIPSPLFQKLNI